jgi:hypothetical protein
MCKNSYMPKVHWFVTFSFAFLTLFPLSVPSEHSADAYEHDNSQLYAIWGVQPKYPARNGTVWTAELALCNWQRSFRNWMLNWEFYDKHRKNCPSVLLVYSVFFCVYKQHEQLQIRSIKFRTK